MAYERIIKDGFRIYNNKDGKTISCGNIPVIEKDGYVFRNLEGSEELVTYEDWRLDDETRAKDLVKRLTLEESLGLMLHSSHQQIPTLPNKTAYPHTYDGKPYLESNASPWDMTDQQKNMLEEEGIRHFLAIEYQDVETAVKWNNNLQSLAEKLPHGIPVNVSSDPRNGVGDGNVEYKSEGSQVSKWPEGIGISATFSPDTCRQFAAMASKEYRALGISTALGPQIDLATEPRWSRGLDGFGGHTKLASDMAKAYCDGMQTTKESPTGWGEDSVLAMAKHWPGGGTGEGGRDAHYGFGKYAVYPGNNFDEHLIPFLEGAMKLDGKTKECAAIMPYYSISWDQDKKYGENVGNAYSEYIIKDLLLNKYGYEGVVCTDWNITQDMAPTVGAYMPGGKCHGVENLSIPERFLKLIKNGVNQFGCVDSIQSVLEAYHIGCERYGKEVLDQLIEASAYKILVNMFRLGLFENPYLDLDKSIEIVGCKEFVEAGYEAQLASLVMIKNKNNVLPLDKRLKVFVPERHIKEFYGFIRIKSKENDIQPIPKEVLEEYFEVVDNTEEADIAIVFAESPFGNGGFDGGYSSNYKLEEGNKYEPISLQYRPYKAEHGRKTSIAGGDPREEDANRSYYGKTAITANEADLDNVISTKEKMGDKPVIVCIRMKNPAVLSELEPYADGILIDFGVDKRALLDIITGEYEPRGLLPILLPKNMETVEKHCEDIAFDMEAYTDTQGNTYNFAFGLNYSGQIKDHRWKKYC